MQKVENKKMAFSGVQITRRGKHPEQTVYRQPTHTDRFLHKDSNHQPTQKYGIIKTLAEGAKKICKADTLDVELKLSEELLYTKRQAKQKYGLPLGSNKSTLSKRTRRRTKNEDQRRKTGVRINILTEKKENKEKRKLLWQRRNELIHRIK